MQSKHVSLLLLILLSFGSFGQIGVNWNSEFIVSDGAIYGNIRPRAALANNIPLIVYGGFGNENLFVSRWNGSSFDTQSILPPGTATYAANWTGPDIAAKGDTVIVVFKLKPAESGHVYVVRSIDGGITFSDTIRVGSYSGGNHWLPSIEINDDGNPTVAIMIHDGQWANPRQALFHSTDAGLTFGPAEEVTINIPGEACDCCPSEVVIDNGREMLLFRNNENNIRDVYGVLSTDNGQTFPYSENVDQLNWSISQCPASGMDGTFIGNDFFTTFSSNASGTYQVYVTRSDVSSGLNMVERVNLPAPANGGQNYPTISGTNDTLVVAWEERIGANRDIYYSVNTSAIDPLGNLSTLKLQANQISVGNQTNPHILYKNGLVHLFYQDDSDGNVMYRYGAIEDLTGLSQITEATAVLYPNPSENGSMKISGIKSVETVCTADGKEVDFMESKGIDGTSIQLTPATNGIFLVHCTDGNSRPRIFRWVNQHD